RELTGIDTIYWLSDFEKVVRALMSEAEFVYLNTNEHIRSTNEVETREERFIKSFKMKYPAHKHERSAPIMHRIRSVKTEEEIIQMRRACNITEAGFRRVLSMVTPGIMEYEIEAELLHEFVRQG